MKRTKRIIAFILLGAMVAGVSGCAQSQASRASYNVSKEADNFNVIRRLTVLNARTDAPLFELVAAFSFELTGNRIVVMCEVGDGVYKKHSIGLNDWTLWVIEDVSGAEVSKYHYEVNFLPKMILPAVITTND